ncbi:hypothetical protein Hokovirus_2_223 [Hokovirus HKV1]|uniref:VWFA domain-containing protein n=1 Tax=Hokovirus HKV1 TaxID=1977638 RepID=A0A1V0SG41_9VIRU|nr:hypothetical protein Hokovirus_2_223 [Hokovirus HKV1]
MNWLRYNSVQINNDNNIILLLDNSGSTSKMINNKSILNSYTKLLEHLNCKKVHLLFWNTTIINIGKININDLEMHINNAKSFGGTYLAKALQFIKQDNIISEKTDIIIVTDGEINDSRETSEELNILLQNKNISIHIFTFEDSDYNYFNNKISAGNNLYYCLQSNKLTQHIKNYVSYNKYHFKEPFINYSNDIKDGNIQFGNCLFDEKDLKKFIKYIANNIINVDDYDTLCYKLSITIYQLLKTDKINNNKINNDKINKQNMIELFAKILSIKYNYQTTYLNLYYLVNKVDSGTASTLNEYITNRNKLFDKTNDDLFENVASNISGNLGFTSIIIPNNNEYIMLDFINSQYFDEYYTNYHTFNNAAIMTNKYRIPIIPKILDLNNTTLNQHIRQWIRALYSNIYNISPGSDVLLYQFLAHVLLINMSNIDPIYYNNLALIMLYRVRFGTGIREFEYLSSYNKPSLNLGSEKEMLDTFELVFDNVFNYKFPYHYYTLWYAFIGCLNNTELTLSQETVLWDFIIKDFPELKQKDVNNYKIILSSLKKLYPVNIKIYDYVINNNYKNLDYTCYITLDNTEETGGYKINNHYIQKNLKIICDPRFIISKEAYDSLHNMNKNGLFNCPICRRKLDLNNFIPIPKKCDLDNDNDNNNDNNNRDINNIIDNLDLNFPKDQEIINLSNIYKNIENGFNDPLFKDNNILSINNLNFNTKAFKFSDQVFHNKKLAKINIFTSEKFNKIVENSKYKFARYLNYDGICIAGGFIKSILLNTQINDIDIFTYGLNKEQIIAKIKHIYDIVQKYCDYDHIILINKKNNNVLEMLLLKNKTHLNDIKNIIANYDSDNYDSDDSDNDSDNDNDNNNKEMDLEKKLIKGTDIECKIQIIIRPNESPFSIVQNFDLNSCRLIYDGNKVYFTEKSFYAYKYMINMLDIKDFDKYSFQRFVKYHDSGFGICSGNMVHSDKNNMIDYDIFKMEYSKNDDVYIIENLKKNTIIKNCNNNSYYSSLNGNDLSQFFTYFKSENDIIYKIYNVNDNNIIDDFLNLDNNVVINDNIEVINNVNNNISNDNISNINDVVNDKI